MSTHTHDNHKHINLAFGGNGVISDPTRAFIKRSAVILNNQHYPRLIVQISPVPASSDERKAKRLIQELAEAGILQSPHVTYNENGEKEVDLTQRDALNLADYLCRAPQTNAPFADEHGNAYLALPFAFEPGGKERALCLSLVNSGLRPRGQYLDPESAISYLAEHEYQPLICF